MSTERDRYRDAPDHPAAANFPMMSDAELDELAADINRNGMEQPIIYWEDNREAAKGAEGPFPLYLLDGRNRKAALKRLGIDSPRDAPGGRPTKTVTAIYKQKNEWKTYCDDPFALVQSLNLYRRHLTAEQKRDAIKALIVADPQTSNREIARKVKADDKTVAAVREQLEATAEIPQLKKTVGADGKARKAKRAEKKYEAIKAEIATLSKRPPIADTPAPSPAITPQPAPPPPIADADPTAAELFAALLTLKRVLNFSDRRWATNNPVLMGELPMSTEEFCSIADVLSQAARWRRKHYREEEKPAVDAKRKPLSLLASAALLLSGNVREGENAVLVLHCAMFGDMKTPVRKFWVSEVKPDSQHRASVTYKWIEPRKRKKEWNEVVADNFRFITIERNGAVIYDSRHDVPCDMAKWEERRAKENAAVREVFPDEA